MHDTKIPFRTLVEQSLVGIYLIQDKYFRYVNPQFCEIFGYRENEVLGKLTVEDLVAESDRDLVMDKLRRRQEGEIKEALYSFNGIRKNGEIINVEVHGIRTIHMGQPAVLGALLDRTAWVRAESDLRIRNRALAAIGEGVVIADAGDKNLPAIYSNDAFSKITGYSPEEIRGRNCRFLQNKDRDQPALKSIRNALRNGHECQAVLRNYRKDGGMFWNELTLSPVKDENGVLTHFVGIQRDITARREIEQQLNLQSAALEAAANPVFIIEMQNRTIQWVNQAFSKLYGYTRDEARGNKPTILDSGHHTEDHWQTLLNTIDSGRPWSNTTVNRTRNGLSITVTEMVTPIMDGSGNTSHLVVVHEDITAQIEANRKLHWMATHDSLTGLPNRAAFREVLEHEIARIQRNGNQLAVHFIDLDHFKEVNDSLGHQTGDEVLKIVAGLLNDIVRKSDMVSRFGGDEFAILQIDTNDANDTNNIALFAERLLLTLNQRLEVGGTIARCGASLGIATYDAENRDRERQEEAEVILERADIALYEAKKKHRGNYIIYTDELGYREHKRIRLTDAMESALAGDQFYLLYQPQINLENGYVIGVEALARWHPPEHGEIGPADFIPVAEQNGLILQLGSWVLNETCRQAQQWHNADLMDFRTIAVNLSALQLREPGFSVQVFRSLELSGLPAALLDLEITESALMEPHEIYGIMETLHSTGIKFSIDDFGTGYSSLLYLKRMPISQLKIDREFILHCMDNRNDAEITRAIIDLAHNLNLTVIAEGVETAEQAEKIREMGCDYAQGFYYSRPVTAAECAELLKQNHINPGKPDKP